MPPKRSKVDFSPSPGILSADLNNSRLSEEGKSPSNNGDPFQSPTKLPTVKNLSNFVSEPNHSNGKKSAGIDEQYLTTKL